MIGNVMLLALVFFFLYTNYTALIYMYEGQVSDLFDLSVENFTYEGEGDNLIDLVHKVLVCIVKKGLLPDLLQTRLLSSVFKRK